MKNSFQSLLKLSFLAVGLAACSSAKEEGTELKASEASQKVRAPAVFKGDTNKKDPAMTDNINDGLGKIPANRAPRKHEDAEGSDSEKSKKEEASKESTEELKAILDFKKAEMEAAERLARMNAINERSEKAAKSNQMLQAMTLMTTLITARQQEKAISSLSQGSESKSEDGCDSSAVGTAKDDLGDIFATMATYGIVTKAGGM